SLRMAASSLRFIGSGHPPLHRFRLGLEFVLSGHREVDQMVSHHAAIARSLAEQLSLPDDVLRALDAAYERWDGRGWPGKLKGDAIPLAARIAQAAEYVEVANRMGGVSAVKKLAHDWQGGQFDPTVAKLLVAESDALLSEVDTVAGWGARGGGGPGPAGGVPSGRLQAAPVAVADLVRLEA